MSEETIPETLLIELNRRPNEPLKVVTRFCRKNNLMHARDLLPFDGKRTLGNWIRKTLHVWINGQEMNYELVGLLFPKWKIKEVTPEKG